MNDLNDSTHANVEVISKENISEALAKKLKTKHFVILRYRNEPHQEKNGLLGDHIIIFVTILNAEGIEENISFFLKLFPKEAAPAKFAEGLGAFRKEVFIYSMLEEFIEKGVDIAANVAPKCYLAEYNKHLVLDNLLEEGFKMLDKHETLDFESVLIVLQALAKLHAASIIYEEKLNKNLLEEYEEDLEESFYNDREGFINSRGIEASIKCVVKEIEIFDFPPILSSGKCFAEIAITTCLKIYQLVKPSKKFRNVLNHGDLWMTNFMLGYDKDQVARECKFFDFQFGRYAPPSQDVLSLIYLTTTREFREKYMYQVIGMYYSYLEKHLKVSDLNINDIIPFSDFMESCEEQKLFAIVQTAMYFPLILISNDKVKEYFSDEILNEKALFEDRSYLVLAHKDTDESYEKRLRESIRDLKEFCEYL
ncbi:uncharacterized protein [Leptinotarsa decemlineata]|uniref:uncharacterized protein n=1 Tax=Leptinotarsa decemlineata TaxID=7539 RepID=UPI003D30648F